MTKEELSTIFDNAMFKILFRAIKENGYSSLNRNLYPNKKSVIDRLMYIRKAFYTEKYFENISFWARDLGLNAKIELAFLSKVLDTVCSTFKSNEYGIDSLIVRVCSLRQAKECEWD